MKLSKALAAATALSLVSAPVAAQAAQATVDQARVGTEISGENIRGGFIIPLIAIIAIILGILAATNDNDDDLPHSP